MDIKIIPYVKYNNTHNVQLCLVMKILIVKVDPIWDWSGIPFPFYANLNDKMPFSDLQNWSIGTSINYSWKFIVNMCWSKSKNLFLKSGELIEHEIFLKKESKSNELSKHEINKSNQCIQKVSELKQHISQENKTLHEQVNILTEMRTNNCKDLESCYIKQYFIDNTRFYNNQKQWDYKSIYFRNK